MSDTPHFLVIEHNSYDSSTVLGIFETLVHARDSVEALLGLQDDPTTDRDRERRSAARNAVIEEWRSSEHVQTYERTGLAWRPWSAPTRTYRFGFIRFRLMRCAVMGWAACPSTDTAARNSSMK